MKDIIFTVIQQVELSWEMDVQVLHYRCHCSQSNVYVVPDHERVVNIEMTEIALLVPGVIVSSLSEEKLRGCHDGLSLHVLSVAASG